jgi:hypothetical protein
MNGERHQAADDAFLVRLLAAMADLRDGDFTRRLAVPGHPLHGRLAQEFNQLADRNQAFVGELTGVREGLRTAEHLTGRLVDGGRSSGRWPRGSSWSSPSGSPRTCRRSCTPTSSGCSKVVRNLLSNAVKFTHDGEVALEVRLAGPDEVSAPRLGRAPARIAFAVRDTGIGIAGQTGGDLRGVPAGRRHDQPQVRRHGPRPVDLSGAGRAARR